MPTVEQVEDDQATLAVCDGLERIDIVKPGWEDNPDGCISVQEFDLAPARARKVAKLLLFAADHLDTLRHKGNRTKR